MAIIVKLLFKILLILPQILDQMNCQRSPLISDVLLRFVQASELQPLTPEGFNTTTIDGETVVVPTQISPKKGTNENGSMLSIKHFSTVRHRLLQQFSRNPIIQQPNFDALPINVMIKLVPVKIQDLIERNEVLETTLRLQLTWLDKRLSWDPLSYSNLTEIVLPAQSIWAPDIAILNSVYDVYHVIRDMRFEMKVESGGRVWWHPTGIVRTYCKLSLRYYPFDRQKCIIQFESPTLDTRFMNLSLRSTAKPVDTRMFTDSETWKVLQFTGRNFVHQVGSKTFFTRVEFMMHIERAHIFHVINFILPAIILSSVEVLFFLLPATHPQRVGSTTTILLSVIVFQTVVVAQLPKTSTDVPLLSVYIFCVTIVSGLSVSTSVFVAKFTVYAEKHVPMPQWLRTIRHPLSFFCKRKTQRPPEEQKLAEPCMIPPSKTKSTEISEILLTSESFESNQQCILKSRQLAKTDEKTDEDIAINIQSDDENKGKNDDRWFLFTSWLDVSIAVDITLMSLAGLIALLSPIVLFIIMPGLAKEVPDPRF